VLLDRAAAELAEGICPQIDADLRPEMVYSAFRKRTGPPHQLPHARQAV